MESFVSFSEIRYLLKKKHSNQNVVGEGRGVARC